MKIVSWNVFNLAKDMRAFRNFVRSADADVYTLQELTTDHMRVLESLADYRIFQAEDCVEDGTPSYLGIATRLPASDHIVMTHNPGRSVSGSIQGRRMKWLECLDSQSIIIEVDGVGVRVVNLHLSCAVSPQIRMQQLEQASAHFADAKHALVCGDFNTYAKLPLNLVAGWFFGFQIADIFVDEIKRLDVFARSHGLVRVFDRVITYPRHRLHLDHMLIRGLAVRTMHVEDGMHGSDHRPIVVELEL